MKVVSSGKDQNVEKLKVPPHSIEAEQSVLGSMLIDPESWDKVAEVVTETDFYNRSHQIIFRATRGFDTSSVTEAPALSL